MDTLSYKTISVNKENANKKWYIVDAEGQVLGNQEGRRGSDEVVSGPSVFPSREPGVSGNFWGSQERCQVLFRTSRRKLGLPLRRHSGQ